MVRIGTDVIKNFHKERKKNRGDGCCNKETTERRKQKILDYVAKKEK